MRAVSLAVMLAAVFSMTGCGLLNASGSAATRWAALDKARAEKANPTTSADASRVCRTMNATGSNVPKRVCSTQTEWDATDAQNRADTEDLNREMRSGNAEPGRDGTQR